MAYRNFEKFLIFMKISIRGFSERLIMNPWLDFENSKWWSKILKIVQFSLEFLYTRFLGRLFRIRCQIFEIRNGASRFIKFSIFMKIFMSGFSGMLITNSRSDFENSKWRFQYGGPKF